MVLVLVVALVVQVVVEQVHILDLAQLELQIQEEALVVQVLDMLEFQAVAV